MQRAIEAMGSRDAWNLIGQGYEGDKDYLAKLIDAILIMKNPESLDELTNDKLAAPRLSSTRLQPAMTKL